MQLSLVYLHQMVASSSTGSTKYERNNGSDCRFHKCGCQRDMLMLSSMKSMHQKTPHLSKDVDSVSYCVVLNLNTLKVYLSSQQMHSCYLCQIDFISLLNFFLILYYFHPNGKDHMQVEDNWVAWRHQDDVNNCPDHKSMNSIIFSAVLIYLVRCRICRRCQIESEVAINLQQNILFMKFIHQKGSISSSRIWKYIHITNVYYNQVINSHPLKE